MLMSVFSELCHILPPASLFSGLFSVSYRKDKQTGKISSQWQLACQLLSQFIQQPHLYYQLLSLNSNRGLIKLNGATQLIRYISFLFIVTVMLFFAYVKRFEINEFKMCYLNKAALSWLSPLQTLRLFVLLNVSTTTVQPLAIGQCCDFGWESRN